MADAGFKLAVEGEREFKKAIAEINAQIKANAAELKLLTAQYGAADTGMEKLTANQKALEEGLALQGQKVSALREQYEKASATYGETDVRVVKLKTSLTEATAEYAKMSGEAEKNQAAIDAAWKAMEDYQEATAKASDVMGSLDDVMAQNRKEIENLTEQYRKLGDGSRDAAAKQENLTAQNKLLADSVESQHKKIDALNEELDAAVRLYGENSEEIKEYRDRVNEATRELNSLEDQIKDNDKALEDSEDAGDGLLESLDKISEVTGIEIPEGIKKMIEGFDDATIAAAGISGMIAGAITKLNDLSAKTREWADELTESSQEMNINPEAYQALEYAVNSLGVQSETIQDVIKEINNRAGETDKVIREQIGTLDGFSQATDEQKQAVYEAMKQWDELGVSIYDVTTGELRPANEVLYDLIDAYGNIANSTERAYKMNDMFGESYRKLNPLVNAGTENIKRLEQEAYDLGVVMDEQVVAKLDASAATAKKAENEFKSVLRTIGAFFQEAFSFQGVMSAFEYLLEKSGGNIITSTNRSKIPPYANGTYNHPGGYALVGEKGPEIVELPRGSRVYPNGTGPQTGTVNNYSITISAKDVREFNDIVRIAEGQKQSIRMGYGRR